MTRNKLAIIGASELQNPLILKAREMGIETHVFAWEAGDVGETTADYFYPISIIEKEAILEKCQEIGIDGVTTIASDLATVAMCYVSNHMGLSGNSLECNKVSTNKHDMRLCFEEHHDSSPKSVLVSSIDDLAGVDLTYPVIVKPLDRSGSRGITKVERDSELAAAIEAAKSEGFEKKALVEEYATGQEYSVEYVSYGGKHHFLAMTRKYTTGAPHFIETGHIQPSGVTEDMIKKVQQVVSHALDSLGVTVGASHSEVKIDDAGNIKIIEIGARMGGDFIGSTLVKLSTGVDFLQAVIECALGQEPDIPKDRDSRAAAVRYIFDNSDIAMYHRVLAEHPEYIYEASVPETVSGDVSDSSARFGYFIMSADKAEDLEVYL